MKRILKVAALTTLFIGSLSMAFTLQANEHAGKNNAPMASGMMSQEGMKGMMGRGGGGMMGMMGQGGMIGMIEQMTGMMKGMMEQMNEMMKGMMEAPDQEAPK